MDKQIWTVGRKGDIISVNCDVPCGFEFRVLVRSDAHIDSPDSDRALQKRHLEQAKAINAPVLDLGDMHDVMQSRNDRRRSPNELKPEYRDRYFNDVNDDVYSFIRPYADLFAGIGTGNHETAVLTHCGVDMTAWLVQRLNKGRKQLIMPMGYSGYVRFYFRYGTQYESKTIYYHHGSGGSAPVTKGTIKTARRSVYLPDADVVLSGHTHESWMMPIARQRVTQQGRIVQDEILHVQIPSYKTAVKPHGWAEEKEFAPQTNGAYWLVFYRRTKNDKIRVDAERAR